MLTKASGGMCQGSFDVLTAIAQALVGRRIGHVCRRAVDGDVTVLHEDEAGTDLRAKAISCVTTTIVMSSSARDCITRTRKGRADKHGRDQFCSEFHERPLKTGRLLLGKYICVNFNCANMFA